MALADQVEHAARCGHEHVNAFFDLSDLWVLFHTAIDAERFDPCIAANGLKRFGYLFGQLSGRLHDQTFDALRAHRTFVFVQQVNDGNGESGRFACSCLCNGEQVLPFQNGWDGLVLYVGRPSEAHFGQIPLDRARYAIVFKFHVGRKGTSLRMEGIHCFLSALYALFRAALGHLSSTLRPHFPTLRFQTATLGLLKFVSL
jgi:hypothetical protein